MRSATTATGRPLPTPGKTLAKNRPAPLSCRAARQLAAPKPHVTSELRRYIPEVTVTDRRLRRKINRQLRRLEFSVSHTKQTPAPQFNRKLLATSRVTTHSSRNTCRPRIAKPLLDTNVRLRRNNNSRNSFKTNDCVSPYSIQTSTPLAAKCITAGSLSNRQWQILEINVNLSKQTIAPRSHRHKNAFIKYQKSPITIARHESQVARLSNVSRSTAKSGYDTRQSGDWRAQVTARPSLLLVSRVRVSLGDAPGRFGILRAIGDGLARRVR